MRAHERLGRGSAAEIAGEADDVAAGFGLERLNGLGDALLGPAIDDDLAASRARAAAIA